MPSDLQHLQRYATTGDAHAFRELVQAHGAMVHATALRVTCNAAAAQDVAQETFLELARKAGGITQSVAAWLHRVAWNRACDAVRRESTR
jgi:RNA polymerase sigma-70 factor (ECF subfamily)